MLAIEPNAGITPVIDFIKGAHGTLDVNTYLLTDRRILRALHTAVLRGVRVRIILAHHPYGGRPRGEVAHIRALGAQIHYAPSRFSGRYVFDHAKYMVARDTSEMGTANLTWSAFHKNREYLWVTHNRAVHHALEEVFQADWVGKRAGAHPRTVLVLSPGAAHALIRVLRTPGPICVEAEELASDRPILAALRKKGHDVRLLLPARLNHYDRRIAETLADRGVRVRLLTRPYLHAKLIAGTREAFMGSQNLSPSSLDRNREVGIVLRGPAARLLARQCRSDFAIGRGLKPRPQRRWYR